MAINTYGGAGQGRNTLSSALVGRDVPTGAPGNFWADLAALSKLRPRTPAPVAARQAATLREPAPQMVRSAPVAAPMSADEKLKEAYYQAMIKGPPMKQLTGPIAAGSMGPAYTMDTNAMTGIQRQIFLPQNSSYSGPQGAPLTPPGIGAESSTGGGSTAGDVATPAESAAHRAFRGWGTMALDNKGQQVVPNY